MTDTESSARAVPCPGGPRSGHSCAGPADSAGTPQQRANDELISRPSDPDELALIAAGFPAFRLWRATTYDRIRYVAQGTSLDAHPYIVVTGDLDELRAALAAGQQAREQ